MNNKIDDELEYSWIERIDKNNTYIHRKLGKDLTEKERVLINSLSIVGFNIEKTKLTK